MFAHLSIIICCSSKRSIFCPLCTFFSGLQTLTKCLSLCSLMMMYESYPEDVVRSGGCAVGVNLGDDTKRVNKNMAFFSVIQKNDPSSKGKLLLKCLETTQRSPRYFNSAKYALTLAINPHFLMCLTIIVGVTTPAITGWGDQSSRGFSAVKWPVMYLCKFTFSRSCISHSYWIDRKCAPKPVWQIFHMWFFLHFSDINATAVMKINSRILRRALLKMASTVCEI